MHKAWEHTKEQLNRLLNDYTYYKPVSDEDNRLKSLTDELDAISSDQPFEESTVLKILLLKIHRYADLDVNLLNRLNAISTLTPMNRREAQPVIEDLLRTEGIDLPIASTLLRFRNPKAFQIIDRRAFRVVTAHNQYNLYSSSPIDRKVAVYFSYLEAIDSLCEKTGIKFADADRILYQFDLAFNSGVRLDSKAKKKRAKPREGWENQFQ